MNPLEGKTEKETKRIITDLKKQIRLEGVDHVSFIKIVDKKSLMFHVTAKNNCGYKSCDIDEERIIRVIE